jgi:hypothetical protein
MSRATTRIAGSGGSLLVHVVGALALLVATGCWYAVVVHPTLTATARGIELERERKGLDEKVAALVVRRDELQAKLRDLEAALAGTEVRLSGIANLNARLGALAALAKEHDLGVERIEPGTPAETPLALRVPVRIEAKGGSPGAIRFMAAMRRAFPDVAIETFAVEREAGHAGAAVPTIVAFDLVWYADRAGEAPATAAADQAIDAAER